MFHLSLGGEPVGTEDKKLGKGCTPMIATSMGVGGVGWNAGREASDIRQALKG